jgi:hypothetical protein
MNRQARKEREAFNFFLAFLALFAVKMTESIRTKVV